MSAPSAPATVRCGRCGAANRIPPAKAGHPARCGRCHAPLDGARGAGPPAVTDATFDTVVLASPVPVLLDCWAAWCGPCRMLAPVIDDLAASYAGRAVVAKLDVDANPRVTARYGIQGIPTLLFFDSGQLRRRLVGVQPRAVLERELEALLAAPRR